MINNVDINEIAVSNKLSFGKQEYSIGYKDGWKIKPLCIGFPKMGTYRSFDENKCMYFLIKEEKRLDKYNEFWKKLSNIIKKI